MLYPSEAEIREDLHMVVRAGYGFIRLFDSGVHAERVLNVIKADRLDLKVQLGIWIDGPDAMKGEANRAEIERGVALANQYPSTIVAVSVGNEVLSYWSDVKTPPEDLAVYIEDVRAQVKQPVGTDDLYPPFTLVKSGPYDSIQYDYANVIKVIEVADFLSVHCYPFIDAPWGSWEWKLMGVPEAQRARAMMDNALAYVKDMLADVKNITRSHGHDIPLTIGETGWKDTTDKPISDTVVEAYMAHPLNQKWYYDLLDDWVYGASKDENSPLTMFYFEAFDEPWKGGDDNWGLFNVDREAKYVLWSRVPEFKPAGAQAPADSEAIYYRP